MRSQVLIGTRGRRLAAFLQLLSAFFLFDVFDGIEESAQRIGSISERKLDPRLRGSYATSAIHLKKKHESRRAGGGGIAAVYLPT